MGLGLGLGYSRLTLTLSPTLLVLEARRTEGEAVPLPAINVIIEAREIARYGRDMGEI